MMTGSEHYRTAMNLLRQVDEAERSLGDKKLPFNELNAWNANAMRVLKKAEIHMLAAQVRK